MPALAPKRASKSLKAERDRDKAPPAYMVRGRKTPRDRDDSYSDDSSRSRSPSDDSRSKKRGFAATKTKKRAPAKSAALGLVRKETDRVRADLDREASRALPAARKRDGGAAKSARAALAARKARSGDAGRLLLTDREKARKTKSRRGASDDSDDDEEFRRHAEKSRRRKDDSDDEKPRSRDKSRRSGDDEDEDDVVLAGLRKAKDLDDGDVFGGGRRRAKGRDDDSDVYKSRTKGRDDDSDVFKSRTKSRDEDSDVYKSRAKGRDDDSDVFKSRAKGRDDDSDVYKSRAKSRDDDSGVWGDKSRKSRADESDVWGDKSRAKSRARDDESDPWGGDKSRKSDRPRARSPADESDVWGDRKSRAQDDDDDAFKSRTKTTTWRVRDVDDDGNTTITSARSPRVIEEARDDAIVNTVRDGGASPVPFSTTRPPDDVAEAFDRLKTENAALRHELAQSLKAADVLAAGGVAAATMAQSLADGDAPGRALDVVSRLEDQGAGPATRTLAEVPMIGAAAPVCAVSAERTMVPKRGPRISVWGAHERAVSSAIEDRITRTQSLDCVSRLRAAVSRVNERDGYTTTSRIYGAFRDAGFLTLTPSDVEDDLCKGLSMDQRGRVDVGELLRLCADVADECAESILGAGDLISRFGPSATGGPPEGWSGDKRPEPDDDDDDDEDGKRRRRKRRSSRSRSRSDSSSRSRSPRRRSSKSRRDRDKRSRSRSDSPRSRRRGSSRRDRDKRSRSRSDSPRSRRRDRRDRDKSPRSRRDKDKRSSSRRGDDKRSRGAEGRLYDRLRAKRDGSRRRRDDSPRSRRDRDRSPRSRRDRDASDSPRSRRRGSSRRDRDRDRDDSPRSRRTASSRVLAKRDRAVTGRDGYPVGKGRRDTRDRDRSRRRKDDDSSTLESRDKSRRRRDDSEDEKSRRRDKSRRRKDDSEDEKSRRRGTSRRRKDDSEDEKSRKRATSRRRKDDSEDEKSRKRGTSRRRKDDSEDEKSRKRGTSRRRKDDSEDEKSRKRATSRRRKDDSEDEKSRKRATSRRRKDDDSVDDRRRATSRRRKDDSEDEKSRRRRDDDSETLKKRDTNRRVTGKVVDAVKRRSRHEAGSPRDAFARSLRRLFEDMDVNGDGVLSKREIRDALLDLGRRDKENAFLKPKELRDLFDDMDLNGDGKVSYDELVDFLVEHVAGDRTARKGDRRRKDDSPAKKASAKEATFVRALKKHFEDVDKDGSGDLSKREVRDALVSFSRKDRSGKFPKKDALRDLFDELDLNGDGYVSYDELCDFIDERVSSRKKSPERSRGADKAEVTFAKALKKHFDDLDKSGDGDLSKREVKQALQSFARKDKSGKYPKLKELAAIFADMDLDGDGHVSYDEICDYIDERVDGKRRRKDDADDEKPRRRKKDGASDDEETDPRKTFAKALKKHFDDLDKSGDDDLSKREVKQALVAFTKKDTQGRFPKLKQLADLFRDMDLNGDGHVSYDELSEFIDGIGGGRDAKKDVTFAKALKKHFDDLDKSGEGDLSKKEVKQALQSFAKKDRAGKYPKLGELRALFDAFDLDGDGYVTYEELCEYVDERVDGKGGGDDKADPRAAFAKALKKHFDDLDKSGDGDLSKREVKHALQSFSKKDKAGKYPKLKEIAAIFADMDLNGDGHVSYEEICDYIDERVGGGGARRGRDEGKGDDTRTTFAKALKKHFDDLDKSGDGDLSKREVKQALQSFARKDKSGKYPKLKEIASIFADMDLDGDGHVSYEEICDYIDERVDGKRRRKDDGSDDDRSPRGKADPRATFAKALKKHFDDLDKSGDGDLSKREVKQALQTFARKDKSGKYPKLKELASIFADMDLDGDGHVSYEEICDYIDERVDGKRRRRDDGSDDDRSPRGKADPRAAFAKALKKHFDDLDKSGDGDLSKREVKQALQTFAKKDRAGKFPKLKELNDIFEDLDLDGDGHVSYDEVCEYIDERVGKRDDGRKASRSDDDDDDDDDASRRSGASWALNDDEYDGLVQKLRRSADGARVPIGALLKAAPRRCEAKLRHLLRDKDPGSATQRKRLGRAACRLRRALCHRARPSGSKKGLDLRELEDAEPELFEEGTLAAFRDCCARLAGCSSADADALFRLVDDDKDGALGRREVIEFVRDTGESWSRRAGLDAAALDVSPRSDGDVSAQYSDEDDDDRSVAFEPLVKQLRKRKAATKRTGGAPHMRAVASRIAGALVDDRDGDYEEGHAGKTRQGYLTRSLYDDLEKSERREGHGVTWDQLYAAFKRRGVVRALSSRDLELLRDEYAGGADLVREWRNLLKAVDEAAGEAPDDSPRDRDSKLARAAAQQLLDAAARTEAKGSDSDSEGGRDAFAQSLRDLFADMDADGDGVLTKREVRDALADLGERDNRPGMRPHQIQKLFDAIDLDGDGEVTYAELVDFLVEQTEE